MVVNAAFRCKRRTGSYFSGHIQSVESTNLVGYEDRNDPVLHTIFHSLARGNGNSDETVGCAGAEALKLDGPDVWANRIGANMSRFIERSTMAKKIDPLNKKNYGAVSAALEVSDVKAH